MSLTEMITVVRSPFTVYRPTHLMTNKILTPGSRFTVTRLTASGEMDVQIAGSRQPVARSVLAHDEIAVVRYP